MTVLDRFPTLRSGSVRYMFPVCVLLLITVACFFSAEVIKFPFLVSFVAAVAVSSFFGRGPGIVALLLATLLSDFFLIPPIFSLDLDKVTLSVAAIYCLAFLLVFFAGHVPLRKGLDQKLKLAMFLVLENFIAVRKTEDNHKPHLLGRLDGAIEGELFGWATDTLQPFVGPRIAIYVGDRIVGEVNASHYRSDVGSHGFYFDLTRCCRPTSAAKVEARFPDGRPLPNSPLMVDIPADTRPRHTERVLFMHIAKTAGTAFREAIVQNYKLSEIAYIYPDPPGLLSDNLGLLTLEQCANLRLVIGHFQYGIHQFFPQQSTYVTVVRDPVARIISQYRYSLEQQPEGDRLKKDSPARLIDALEQRNSVTLDNHMVRCFSGVSEKDFPPGHIDRQVYELAVNNLKTNFSFVGHQEASAEAYTALQRKFHWKPHVLEITNKSVLPAAKDYESARAGIESFNRWDCRLYSEICRLFPRGSGA
jgi:Domain of unknown function (DUF4118)/Sulfotransferase family